MSRSLPPSLPPSLSPSLPQVSHGIQLSFSPPLQYLYYLDQVGCAVSPISNNFLFKKLSDNPFYDLFRRGLNVSLSTDDPMLFHMSSDPLLEEYVLIWFKPC